MQSYDKSKSFPQKNSESLYVKCRYECERIGVDVRFTSFGHFTCIEIVSGNLPESKAWLFAFELEPLVECLIGMECGLTAEEFSRRVEAAVGCVGVPTSQPLFFGVEPVGPYLSIAEVAGDYEEYLYFSSEEPGIDSVEHWQADSLAENGT